MLYAFKALNKKGERFSGKCFAKNPAQAKALLKSQSLTTIEVVELGEYDPTANLQPAAQAVTYPPAQAAPEPEPVGDNLLWEVLTMEKQLQIPYEIKKSLMGNENVAYHCPNCHTDLESKLEEAGTQDKCPKCSRTFRVPGVQDLQLRQRSEQSAARVPGRKAGA